MITDKGSATWIVAVLALAHMALALGYACLTPYRTPGYLLGQRSPQGGPAPVPDIGAPDERQHVNYVIHLLEYGSFPVLRPTIPNPSNAKEQVRNPALIEEYEAHQPPAYYLLAAGFSRMLGLELDDPIRGRPIRFLNPFFGMATVFGVYFLALWGLRRQGVAFFATAIAALLPMHAALSGAASNDPMTFAICTWVLALCALSIRQGWEPKRTIGIGLLVGIGLLTKSTAILLIPTVGIAMLLGLRRPKLVEGMLAMLLALLAAYPWWLRNQQLYGDPLGIQTFKVAFADAIPAADFSQAFGGWFVYWTDWVGWWTARSFVGVFGYMDVFLNEAGTPTTRYSGESAAPNLLYWVVLAGFLIAILGFGLGFRKLMESGVGPVLILNGVFLVLVALFFIQYNLTYFQGQGRYFYPAVGPICLALSLGFSELAGKRKQLVAIVICFGLLSLNGYALLRLPGEFARRMKTGVAEPIGRVSPSEQLGGMISDSRNAKRPTLEPAAH